MDKSRQQFEEFISKGDYPWVKGIIPVMLMVWEASRESLEKERDEAIKHLILVFRQYANNDHLFMSAGEDACEFLDNLGYGIDTGRNLELTDKGKQLIKEDWE
ncbi:hypothetical protein R2S03_14410 [Hafnia alvei]|uniref:hypothetical protein n=1 Tax=Proteus vulgaris TaxID=585 RepID=UPI00299CEE44|nr:hypothetical protein [Proteus vulgaris]WOO48666.1 hypothetical protein R2S03_14410 [Hafnia alvei]WPF03130.1 hypothetical protein SB028_13245 [Proteus vulgaris]